MASNRIKKFVKDKDDLILLKSDGVIGKYYNTKDGTIIEAIGSLAVPRDEIVHKYKGIVKWSEDISLTLQVNTFRKICRKYSDISISELLNKARSNESWCFGEFYANEACDILHLAKKYNVCIEITDISSGEKYVI